MGLIYYIFFIQAMYVATHKEFLSYSNFTVDVVNFLFVGSRKQTSAQKIWAELL